MENKKVKKYYDVDLYTYNSQLHCEQKTHYKDFSEDFLNKLKKLCTCEDFVALHIEFSFATFEEIWNNDSDKKV